MNQKAQQFGWRTTKAIRTFGIKDNQSNIAIDHLRILEKYIQDLYDLENCPKDISIEAEKELNEEEKGPTILNSKAAKFIKDIQT